MAISIPETQNAAVVEKPGKDAKAIVKQLPVEDPKEGEVLIKMEATGGIRRLLKIALMVSLSYRFAFAKGRLEPCYDYDLSCWRTRGRGKNCQTWTWC